MDNVNNNSLFPNGSHYIVTNINNLAAYARTLSEYHRITQDQQKRFLDAANGLENTSNKWQNGIGRCLSKSDIVVLYDFGELLTCNSINSYCISSSIYDRLAKFWSYIQHIPDNRTVEVVTGQPNSGASLPSSSFDRLNAVKENTNLMINTVVERSHNNNNILLVLDIPTILLTVMTILCPSKR